MSVWTDLRGSEIETVDVDGVATQWPQYEAPVAVNELPLSFTHDNEA